MKYCKIKFIVGYVWIRIDYVENESQDFLYIEGLSIEDHSVNYSENHGNFTSDVVKNYYSIAGTSVQVFKDDIEDCTEEEFLNKYREALNSFNI